MPKVGMHYNYKNFIKELDQETEEIIAEMQEEAHKRGLAEKEKAKKEIVEQISKQKFHKK